MSTSKVVKLLGYWTSPFVLRVQIALNIKSVDYEILEDGIKGVKSELLLKSNPVYRKIPVLIHGEKPICESMIIVRYIDEVWTHAPSILPSDPHDRALACFWAAYIDDKLIPAMREATMRAEGDEAPKATMENVGQGFALLEGAFVECSKGKAFFGGDHIGFVDIALGCLLSWLKAFEKMRDLKLVSEANTPCLFKWAERFSCDDAVKNVMPEPDKLIAFAREVILAGPKDPPPRQLN